MFGRMKRVGRQGLAGGLALAVVLSGCATTSAPARLQTIKVTAVTDKGAAVDSARCMLRNGSGEWDVTAPGQVQVVVDSQPLKLRCESADKAWAGEAVVEARSSRGSNMLIGAGVGALVGAAAGDKQRHHDNTSGKGLLSSLNIVGGVLFGALLGTGAGALATPDTSYADSVRVSLSPAPKSDR